MQTLLLHSCCGPCSTTVLERLSPQFSITVFFYNPNIYPESEYEKRLDAQKTVIAELNVASPIACIAEPYDTAPFCAVSAGLESKPERGERCTRCFTLRLEQTAQQAAKLGFDQFGTTLTVSPHKNAALINQIGTALGEQYGVTYLSADFKKQDGYRRSVELAKALGLYRQSYCGCRWAI